MKFFRKFWELFHVSGRSVLDEEIEDILFESGLSYTIVNSLLRLIHSRKLSLSSPEKTAQYIKEYLRPILKEHVFSLLPDPELNVLFFVGINGVGKTTTLAKVVNYCMKNFALSRKKIVMIAADTYRSGAIEQLKIHAESLGVDIIAQKKGADSSAVIFDGLQHAKASSRRLICIDTAGRMNTRDDLMRQLEKNYRVADKLIQKKQRQTFLVLDGSSGQNTVSQAEVFSSRIPIDTLILAKYDGGTRGGIIASIAHSTGTSCAFLGTGEKYTDIKIFNKEEFLNDFVSL